MCYFLPSFNEKKHINICTTQYFYFITLILRLKSLSTKVLSVAYEENPTLLCCMYVQVKLFLAAFKLLCCNMSRFFKLYWFFMNIKLVTTYCQTLQMNNIYVIPVTRYIVFQYNDDTVRVGSLQM